VLPVACEQFATPSGREDAAVVVLTDGGVYDNLGLETLWKRHRMVPR
jgi:hypothetical protein